MKSRDNFEEEPRVQLTLNFPSENSWKLEIEIPPNTTGSVLTSCEGHPFLLLVVAAPVSFICRCQAQLEVHGQSNWTCYPQKKVHPFWPRVQFSSSGSIRQQACKFISLDVKSEIKFWWNKPASQDSAIVTQTQNQLLLTFSNKWCPDIQERQRSKTELLYAGSNIWSELNHFEVGFDIWSTHQTSQLMKWKLNFKLDALWPQQNSKAGKCRKMQFLQTNV